MSIALARSYLVVKPTLRRGDDIRLRLDGARTEESRPVGYTSGDGEGGWVSEQLGTAVTERE